MNVHLLEHDPAEGPGAIAAWAEERGHTLVRTPVYRGESLPVLTETDFLIVMGGPMSVHQHRDHPWLPDDKRFLGEAIAAGKPVLGICLGAQLLADALGGKVFQNAEKEIGWFPVRLIDRAQPFAHFPEKLTVMHWHGDTFTLPAGARCVAESEACAQQAFVFGDRVVGLQFHLEMGQLEVADLSEALAADLVPGRYVQKRAQLLAPPADLSTARAALFGLLDGLARCVLIC
jgi:GMP synthase (glutamine-hydrolysing)